MAIRILARANQLAAVFDHRVVPCCQLRRQVVCLLRPHFVGNLMIGIEHVSFSVN
jgi:hypothetical protein